MHLLRVLRRSIFQPDSLCKRSGDFSGSHAFLYMSMIFPLTMAPLPRTCFFPIVLLLLLRLAVRGACRLCLLGILLLLALAAFPHRDLTLFALGGLAVWCLMPGRDPKEKRQDDNS